MLALKEIPSKSTKKLSGLKINNPAKYFLIVGLTFGLLFIIFTPPFQGPDEGVHFLRVTQIANGNIIPDVNNGIVGGETSKGITDLFKVAFDEPQLPFHPENNHPPHTSP